MSHVPFSSADCYDLDRLIDGKNSKHSAGLLIWLIHCRYYWCRIIVLSIGFKAFGVAFIKFLQKMKNPL